MDRAVFFSKAKVFSGDCGGDLHNSEHEPNRCFHYHDFYEIFVYLGKTGAFRIGEKEYAVRRGDIVLVDMFIPHMMIPGEEGNNECFVAHINPELLITYSTPSSNMLDVFPKGENHPPVHSICENRFGKYLRLMDEYAAIHRENARDILLKALIHQLMAYTYIDCFSGVHCNLSASRDLTVVTQIIRYINEHLTGKISLKTLSREINYSECYLCHLFKEATHKTISGYIQEKRIEMAAGLLAGPLPIRKAAEQSGFSNYSHFYKTFKRQMGCNPAEYRQRLQAGESL